jgi:NADPH-dependent 2,4-dienoyl-CoA reductase/sulfur reductase-like enzyme
MPDHAVIVGGGVAAMRCALELRERGFDGQVSMLSAESTPPYDRTLVSKALISGDPVEAAARRRGLSHRSNTDRRAAERRS